MVDIEVSQETTNRLHAILSGLGKADEERVLCKSGGYIEIFTYWVQKG